MKRGYKKHTKGRKLKHSIKRVPSGYHAKKRA